MVLIKNLTQSQINGADNFKGEVVTNAETNKLMFNTGTNFTYLVYSDLNNIISGLSGISATDITGTITPASANQPNITQLGTLEGLTVNNNLVVADHNGVDKGLTLGGALVTSSAAQLNYVNTTPGTAEAGKALITDSNNSIVGLTNLETDNLTVNGTLVTSSAIELNYVDVETLGQAFPNKALVLDANKDIVGINTLEADYIKVNGTLVTSSAIELNYVDVATLGTAEGSKALVLSPDRDIANIRNLTADNLTGTLQTAAQPNVTSLGDLTGLTVAGHTDLQSLSVNGVPLDAFNLGGLKMRVYSNPEFTGRVIKADIVEELNFTNYEPVTGVTENYSMEIWGYIKPLYTENYIFTVSSNDKFRLWINNELVKVAWTTGDHTELQTASIPLTANSWYPIYVQHAQLTGTENFSINWSSATQTNQLLPANAMAYDDKVLNITSKKSYTQDSINLYDGVNSNISSISTNATGDLELNAFSNFVNIIDHNGVDAGLKLGGALVTSTAEELNYVDTTAGSAQSLKAVVLDLNKDTAGIRNIATVGTIGINSSAPSKQMEINSATGDALRLTYDNANGTATNYSDMTISSDGKLTINSSGNETIIHSSDNFNVAGHNGSTLGLKLNDVLVTSTAVELNYVDTTPGAAEASKALVVDTSRNITNVNVLSTSKLTSVSTDDSTSISTGAITTTGGVGISKNLNVGGVATVVNTTNATAAATAALVVSGGAGIKKALFVGEEGTSVTTTSGGTALGTSWTNKSPTGLTGTTVLSAVTHHSSYGFVAVGSSSGAYNILSTSSGNTWYKYKTGLEVEDYNTVKGTRVTSGNDTIRFSDVAYGAGKFVAVMPFSSSVSTSTDGSTWSISTPGGSYSGVDSICYSEDLEMFVGVGSQRVLTSVNGTAWISRTPAGSISWKSVCWSSDLMIFVAVGSNAVMTSEDGINWTLQTPSAGSSWSCVTWAGGAIQKFIACAASYGAANNVMTSSNGADWTNATGTNLNAMYDDIYWSPSLDMIVIKGIMGGLSNLTSTDGINWTQRTTPGGNYGAWVDSLNRFVIVSSNDYIYTSVDGINWTTFYQYQLGGNWGRVAAEPGGVAVCVGGDSPNSMLKITTGTSIDVVNSEFFDIEYITHLGKYVTIGRYSFGPDAFFHVSTSSDSQAWAYNSAAVAIDAGTSDLYNNVYDLQMAYSSTLSRTVVVGTNVILSSADCISWTETRLTGKDYTAIAWAAGSVNKFIAVGLNGVYSTSSDGLNWTHSVHSSGDNFTNVAFSPTLNKFIMTSLSTSYSSTDGSAWTSLGSVSGLNTYEWKNLKWLSGTNQYVAVSNYAANSLLTSSDGITWNTFTGTANVNYTDFAFSSATNNLLAVTKNNSTLAFMSSYSAGTSTTTVTPADGYFNLKGKADILGGIDVEGVVNMNNTTQSTSATTGALIVDGGVGVAKNVNVGGTLAIAGNTTLSANVVVDGPSLRLPVGNTTARPTGVLGQVRYNTETSQFEGFGAGSNWGSLGGVSDVNQDTKILAETSAGANDDNLRFFNNGNENMRLTKLGLMGLGTSAPDKKLEINSATGDVLRMTYDDADGSAVNYADMTISADGKLTINSSGNETIIHSSDSLNISGHDGSTLGLKLNGALVTSTAVELNYVDTTPGTAEASKALVVDDSRNIANINNINSTGDILATGSATTSNLLLSSADVDDYASIKVDSNYVLQQTNTGFQWNTGADSITAGSKIMELDTTLSLTVPQEITNTTDSSSSTTGALKVAGGVGIAKSLNVGENMNVSGNVVVDGPSLRLPVGNTTARPAGVLGQVRYNSETSQFEGFGAGSNWGSLGGVSDVNQDTKILAETAAGDNDDNLRFFNNGNENMRLTKLGLMGLGTTTPSKKLEINSATGDVLRMTYNDTDGSAVNYVDMTVSESGYLTIDSSGNEVVIHASDNFNIAGHDGSTMGFKLNSVLVTSTAEELNYVDTTPGTAEASKALVLNSGRDISNINVISTSILNSVSTDDSSSISTGAITTTGGAGIAKNLNVGGITKITNLTNSTGESNGALIVSGGVEIKKALYIGEVEGDGYFNLKGDADISGSLNLEGAFNMNNTTESTSVTTGALVVDGGVGIVKNLNVGGDVDVAGSVTMNSDVVVEGPSLRIPVGDTATRPVGVLGQVRYNSETSQFEGFGAGSSWGSLGGVSDVNQDTKILAETAAGENDDNLRFFNNGNENMRLTKLGLMGLGTNAPSKKLEINSATGDVLRLTYDDADGSAVNYADMNISADGKLTINSSGNETIIHSSDNFNIAGHNGSTLGLKLADVLVTATAVELNYVDTTPGAAEASKALIMDVNRDINNINILTADTINVTTFGAQDLTAENINTTGNVGINTSDLTFGLQINEATGNVLRLTYNDNSGNAPTSKADLTMDDSNNLTISASNSVNISTHNGVDKGLKLNGTLITATAVELNYVDTTPGAAEASKALIMDANRDITNINSISMNNLNLTHDSSVVDTSGVPLTITRTTSGTPANGLGVGMAFKIENSANANVEFGNVNVVSSDITSGSEDGQLTVNLMTNGVAVEALRLSSTTLFVQELHELSDIRTKENIINASLEATHEKVLQLRLVNYNYIGQDKTHTGVIAQEVKEIIPVAVEEESRNGIEDLMSVSTRELCNYLIGSVQVLSKKLENLSAEFEAYKQTHP
jgi:hypothetical protein